MKLKFLSLLGLLVTGPAVASNSDVPAYEQTIPRHIAIFRTKAGTVRRCTASNTQFVRACPDADSLHAADADTTGECIFLDFVSSDQTWISRINKLEPASSHGRRGYTIVLTNGAGADTTVGHGYVLDEAPGEQSVDTYALAPSAVTSTKVDSTSGFTFNTTYQTHVNLRETGASATGIYAPYGTTDATGAVIQIGGSGSSLGKAIYVKDWSGIGFSLTRKAAVASSANAVSIDLSADSDTTNVFYGQKIDYSGSSKARGIQLVRSSGNSRTDRYGIYLDVSGGTQYGGTINYGAYLNASATGNGTSRNVALKLNAATTNDGRALWTTAGDVQIGDSGDTDSLMVYDRLHAYDDTKFDKPIGLKAPFSGRFLVAAGDSTVTVSCSGIDATNYEVIFSPRNNWSNKVLWAVVGTNQFIVHATAVAGSGGYSGAYAVYRKF